MKYAGEDLKCCEKEEHIRMGTHSHHGGDDDEEGVVAVASFVADSSSSTSSGRTRTYTCTDSSLFIN